MKFVTSLALLSLSTLSAYALPLDAPAEDETISDTLETRSKLMARKDDYPYKNNCDGVDPWNFYKCQCTSFVAWRITEKLDIKFTNWYKGEHFGNANLWDKAAKAAGVSINKTPKVNSVAQSNDGENGHVAWITKVDGSDITVEEYNYEHKEKYNKRTVNKSKFDNFIHFK